MVRPECPYDAETSKKGTGILKKYTKLKKNYKRNTRLKQTEKNTYRRRVNEEIMHYSDIHSDLRNNQLNFTQIGLQNQ